MKRFIPLIATWLLVASCLCKAQELRSIEFTTYGQFPVRDVEYSPISALAQEQGEQPEPAIQLETHSLARMGPYIFKGDNTITFLESGTQNIAAKVTLPDHSNKWLLIFVKNPRFKKDSEGQLKYLVYPFDDSLKNLPNNGLVFLNISGKKLDGLLENKRVTFEAGESNSYRVQESLPINLWARSFDGEKLLPALIKTYKFNPNHRYLMIFFPPVLRGSIDLDVRFLSEAIE